MTATRSLRQHVGRLLIGVVLFAQLTLATHACPSLNGTESAVMGGTSAVVLAAADSAAAMPPGCDHPDPDVSNVCVEHCHAGQQSADTAAAPAVGLGIPTLLYALPSAPQLSLGSGRTSPAIDARLAAAPEPPHAILHCVFRI